jgi:hypothetical protein
VQVLPVLNFSGITLEILMSPHVFCGHIYDLCTQFHMVHWLIKLEALAVIFMFEILQEVTLTKVAY